MKTRNVLKALAVALLLSSSAAAQFSISGKVQSSDGENLPGTQIYLESIKKSVIADDDGNYFLRNVPPGNHVVKARLFGYRELSNAVIIKDKDVVHNLVLRPSFTMQEGIDVLGVRATEKTPTTYTNIDREQIEAQNYGQDLPYLLETTPSTVVTSDAGAGVGYTGVRIRGVDPTRTNVTVNGIPINDSESHGVFWVNMPDFASSVEDMQVQRGVGTSANGGAAFGASININSNQINEDAYGELDNSYGSFNTLKHTVRAGTGLINDKFTLDARLSKITSDGFIDRASSDLKSFYLSGAWYGKKTSVKANIFSGQEETYQAWYGVPEGRLRNDEDMMLENRYAEGLTQEQYEEMLAADSRTYNRYTYENEVDNYQQDHYQLLFNHKFNKNWNGNLAFHYTRGRGYYEQFRENDRFSTYGFDPIEVEGDVVNRMDVIRRRWLDNHFGGAVFYANYNKNNLDLTIGGGANVYDGDHFGEVIWAQYLPTQSIRDRYYDNNAFKTDANLYVKATYEWNKFIFFGDVQGRHIDYTFLGIDEVDNDLVDLEQQVDYLFLNPKAGLSYKLSEKSVFYASYALSNREPVRRDFRETTPDNRPLHETLFNLEAGYRYNLKNGFVNANFFHMMYDNQLVLTGEINDVGGYTRTNVKDSYRAGIEIEGGYKITNKIGITGDLMVSQNRISQFTEYVDEFDVNWNALPQREILHENTDLAFSPNFIAGASINYAPIKGLKMTLINKYVGEQFLDNTSNDTRKLDAYFITHFNVAYTVKTKLFSELTFGLRVNNLLDTQFENNGYTWSYIFDNERVQQNFYFPQAGRHFMARVLIKL